MKSVRSKYVSRRSNIGPTDNGDAESKSLREQITHDLARGDPIIQAHLDALDNREFAAVLQGAAMLRIRAALQNGGMTDDPVTHSYE